MKPTASSYLDLGNRGTHWGSFVSPAQCGGDPVRRAGLLSRAAPPRCTPSRPAPPLAANLSSLPFPIVKPAAPLSPPFWWLLESQRDEGHPKMRTPPPPRTTAPSPPPPAGAAPPPPCAAPSQIYCGVGVVVCAMEFEWSFDPLKVRIWLVVERGSSFLYVSDWF
jgi:hypothetical protein